MGETPPYKTSLAAPTKAKVLERILGVEGNERCADCGAHDPQWASLNLGVTLCIGTFFLEFGLVKSIINRRASHSIASNHTN
jgi:hypothetical protein